MRGLLSAADFLPETVLPLQALAAHLQSWRLFYVEAEAG